MKTYENIRKHIENMKTYKNMSKRMTEKHMKSCTENIQKTYQNIQKYVKRMTENIQKCAQKTYRKHIKTYGNMSKRITENIRIENICSIQQGGSDYKSRILIRQGPGKLLATIVLTGRIV